MAEYGRSELGCGLSAAGGDLGRSLDQFGCPTTARDPRAVEAWNAVGIAFLAHAAALPEKLAALFALEADFALGQLCKGYFMLLLGRRELDAVAAEAFAVVELRREALNHRERAYLDGLGLYLDGRIGAAADRLDAALTRWPEDAVLVKLVHALRFVAGDARGMRRSLEAVLGAYEPAQPGRAYIRGCYAFALEETGAYVEAERIGREAVAGCNSGVDAAEFGDAWGLHAVAHVFDMTNRAGEGVSWIKRQKDCWSHCNNFRYHVWWHLALFHLDRNEYVEVLHLYDSEIRRDRTDDYRDISNAASLLTRLELEGVGVGDRWVELADLAEARVEDGCVVFADLHYMLALGAGGRRGAEGRLIAALNSASTVRASATARPDQEHVAAAAGAPAADGLAAFARGDYAQAWAQLSAAEAAMPRIGGSWAQRDVFERIAIDSALRAGLLDAARGRLQRRLRQRGALDAYADRRLARIAELSSAMRASA